MPKNIAIPLRAGVSRLDAVDPARLLEALPQAILAIDTDLRIRYVNSKAEEFFSASAATLQDVQLTALIPGDSPVFALIRQVLKTGAPVAEHGLVLDERRAGRREISIQATPLGGETPDLALVTFSERSIAGRLDQQWNQRGTARSVGAMASMLAHEVRNPLLGIRGAAQLLEQDASSHDLELTRLICDETDRIKALIDRMEIFSDDLPLEREALNIHTVLEQVRRVASSAGYGRHVNFVERYDPSLPSVLGHREQLVRVFTNLVKNAAEAISAGEGGEIKLTTAYQSGLRLALPNGQGRAHLPLVVTVEDNGDGIPEAIRPHLFDAFVSGKTNGTGLGLAMVAKIIGDHGGLIEVESLPRRTIFRVFLPMTRGRSE